MTHPLEPTPLLAVGASVVVATLLLAGWLLRRGRTRKGMRTGTPAVRVAAMAAIVCTAYSADTSWRFASDYLDISGSGERTAMFAAAELALFATALLARQNLNGPQQAPGLPGMLTWAITTVQVIPAYAESGPVGGTVRAFVGPVMAALLWHQTMGIELRLHKPDAASHSILARAGRNARERLLSRLGIAERDRDAAQITRDRATTRAVALAAHLAERTPKQRTSRRDRRTIRRLAQAVARADVGADHHQRQQLMDQLGARRHAAQLATIELPSPWEEFTSNGDPVLRNGPTRPRNPSLSDDAQASRKEATESPDHGRQPEPLRAASVQTPLPPHETAPAPGSTELPSEEGHPMTQRYGRPPGAEMDELLAIGRKAVEVHGKATRTVLRNAVREAGHTISENRLTELKGLLPTQPESASASSAD